MKKFHPFALLLKYEGYPPAVIASIFMHACLLAFILGRSVEPSDFVTIEDPVIVVASAIELNPQRLRRLERLELERQDEVRRREQAEARDREQRQQREREQREAEQRREQEIAERQRQEELDRQRALDEEAERQRIARESQDRQLEQERLLEQQRLAREQSAREAQANQFAGEQLIVAQYAAIIKQAISQNWAIPPSGRNGMMAVVQLQVVPTGEVVNAFISQSSGDTAFDRSVIQAVERVDRFPELQDLETGVFERNFRNFSLVFRPEDLLR